jgi:hypothetical protein
MRRILAGLLILITSSTGLAQQDEVESVGFNSHYRPDAWTPLVVRVTPEKSGTYRLQVIQEDLDGDQPSFDQEITLTGADEGKAEQQRFWMYFIPQPTHGGLYDVNRGGTLKEINGQLRVILADKDGKQLKKLPITSTIINLEPPAASSFVTPRGTKMILAVSDGRSKLIWTEYEKALGVLETVVMVPLQPKDLPENPRGYDAVDTIIWTNAEAPDPSSPTGERRMRALQKWVRGGGRLVICQPPERDRVLPWGDMLPVIVNEVTDKPDLAPLNAMAMPISPTSQPPPGHNDVVRAITRVWAGPYGPQGPFRVGRADAKPNTYVAEWIQWDPKNRADRSPYLVRMGYGLGSVTWVAQDLGDPAIVTRATLGWTNVWNRILGYNDTSLIPTNTTTDEQKKHWDGGMVGVDLYPSMMRGAELGAKSRAFVGLAIIFFVVYWLIAGPGLYLYLLAKARAYMSWFAFGAAAILATAVTVLVVQLVVRGAPELAHVSVVRKASGDAAVVHSRFGLYIPQDGPQEIRLRDTDPQGDSYITAMAAHPKYVTEDSAFLSFANYTVPVHQPGSGEAVQVAFPYRSTMRQLQARWTGILNAAVEGSGKVVHPNDGAIQGTITNGTGRKLRNVYLAFHHPNFLGRGPNDVIFYLPDWDVGVSHDLTEVFSIRGKKSVVPSRMVNENPALYGLPERGEKVWGTLSSDSEGWPGYWYQDIRNNGIGADRWDDSGRPVKKAFPMLSFFSRLPPVRNPQRVEVLRRGQRYLDLGHALAAGQLVVLAEANDTPIPIPLDVEGDKVLGNGTTFYQFVLPLDRTAPVVDEDDVPAAPTNLVEKPGEPRRIGGKPAEGSPPLLNPLE